MFTVVCWTEICDMSWIMDLQTRKPTIPAGLSGYATDFNISTRQGPPPRKQAKKSAVSMEYLKDLGGKTRQQFPRCPAPTVQVLPAHVSPGVRTRSTPAPFGKAVPEDVPAHG